MNFHSKNRGEGPKKSSATMLAVAALGILAMAAFAAAGLSIWQRSVEGAAFSQRVLADWTLKQREPAESPDR